MMMRGTGLAIAVLALGGCCGSDPVTDTGYASMQVYGPQISACIAGRACERLCADKFGLDDDVEIVGCEITAIDRRAPDTSTAPDRRDAVLTRAVERPAPAQPSGTRVADDLALVIGVSLRVTYLAPATCEFGIDVSAGDDGWTDDDTGDDTSDDGSTDDGSDDDGSDDYPDDDSGDDSGDDGDDGDDGDTGDDGGDDGGGDDGGGDDGGWGGTIRGGGARSVHPRAAAGDHRPAGGEDRISGGRARGRLR